MYTEREQINYTMSLAHVSISPLQEDVPFCSQSLALYSLPVVGNMYAQVHCCLPACAHRKWVPFKQRLAARENEHPTT